MHLTETHHSKPTSKKDFGQERGEGREKENRSAAPAVDETDFSGQRTDRTGD